MLKRYGESCVVGNVVVGEYCRLQCSHCKGISVSEGELVVDCLFSCRFLASREKCGGGFNVQVRFNCY